MWWESSGVVICPCTGGSAEFSRLLLCRPDFPSWPLFSCYSSPSAPSRWPSRSDTNSDPISTAFLLLFSLSLRIWWISLHCETEWPLCQAAPQPLRGLSSGGWNPARWFLILQGRNGSAKGEGYDCHDQVHGGDACEVESTIENPQGHQRWGRRSIYRPVSPCN